MLTLCHAVKGGSGTTAVTALAALTPRTPTLAVDLDHDLPLVFGLPELERPGVVDWLDSDAPDDHLDDLLVPATPTTWLLRASQVTTGATPPADRVPSGAAGSVERWMRLASWCHQWAGRHDGAVVVDAGLVRLPEEFVVACTQRLLVTRACYLSLKIAAACRIGSTGIVLVTEPGRGLRADDVERAVRAPIVASLEWDPAIARSIDAGLLLTGRVPRGVGRQLAALTSGPPARAAA